MVEPLVSEDFLNLFAGKLLGQGMSRKVFDLPLVPGHVVKIEEGIGNFQNIIESEIWGVVESTEYAKWFAPVIRLSPTGRVLVMARTRPMSPDQYPKRVPAFFTDLKYGNWGLYKGRPVCHDYGLASVLMTTGLTARTKNAHWYDA